MNLFDGYIYNVDWMQYMFFVSMVVGDEIFLAQAKLSNGLSGSGEAGNDNPHYNIFTVSVKKNTTTGKFDT